MSKPKLSKTLQTPIFVPQDEPTARGFLTLIGEHARAVTRLEADMNDAIAHAKAQATAKAKPHQDAIAALTSGLRTWCEANRARLTDNHKVKFADLGTGKVLWRTRPPAVSITGKVEVLLERLRALHLPQFIRTSETLNKEAMLADPELAITVPGIRIASAGEDFEAVPFETELVGAAS